MPTDPADSYWVWGIDNAAYGPIELPTLHQWILNGLVIAESYVFAGESGQWLKAKELPILAPILARASKQSTNPAPATGVSASVNTLGRMRLFADLNPSELADISAYCTQIDYAPFKAVVTKGEPGNAMFLVLDGELRAFDPGEEKEVDFTMLGVGEFFGEISLLDHGARSASVHTTMPSMLLRMTGEQFNALRRDKPLIAEKFLYSLARATSIRMRRVSKQYTDSMGLWTGQ